MRPYFKFHALYMRYNGTVQENKKRLLYSHFGPLRAMSVIRILFCAAGSWSYDQERRKGGADAGIPGVAAGALDSEHKKKPRRAARVPGPAGLCVAISFFPEYRAGYNQGFRIRTLCI